MLNSGKRLDAAGKLAKGGRRAIPIVVLGVLATSALGAYAVHSAARSAVTGFSLSASPTQRTTLPGATASYRIVITRRGYKGSINLTASGARALKTRLTTDGASARTLTVSTSAGTPAGRYQVAVRARGGGIIKTVRLLLVVAAPKPVSVGVTGSATGLQPGVPQTLDLALRNPSGLTLSVTGLTVAATSLAAARASTLLPCALSDFSMRQFSGAYPLVVPPSSTRTLSALGVPAALRPQVILRDSGLNQDGCQGAVVSLSFKAQGTGS